jgi:hypothetical protein
VRLIRLIDSDGFVLATSAFYADADEVLRDPGAGRDGHPRPSSVM